MSSRNDADVADIKQIVAEIRSLLTLLNHEQLEKAKERLLPTDSTKKKIYDLCDGSRNTPDIAQALQKSNDYVSSYISILKREGLIRTTERSGKQAHEQVF